MTKKSEELYQRLFQEVNELGEENDLELKAEFVLTDCEKAAINAIISELANTRSKGCHFHLGQSVYRQVPNAELAQ